MLVRCSSRHVTIYSGRGRLALKSGIMKGIAGG